jgi:hypothetical protein
MRAAIAFGGVRIAGVLTGSQPLFSARIQLPRRCMRRVLGAD